MKRNVAMSYNRDRDEQSSDMMLSSDKLGTGYTPYDFSVYSRRVEKWVHCCGRLELGGYTRLQQVANDV